MPTKCNKLLTLYWSRVDYDAHLQGVHVRKVRRCAACMPEHVVSVGPFEYALTFEGRRWKGHPWGIRRSCEGGQS